jgi:hypothetical protein
VLADVAPVLDYPGPSIRAGARGVQRGAGRTDLGENVWLSRSYSRMNASSTSKLTRNLWPHHRATAPHIYLRAADADGLS